VSELGRSIDELEFDLFLRSSAGLGHEGLSKGENSLLDSDDASFEDEEVFGDVSVSGETSHRGNSLLGDVGFGASGRGVVLLSDPVDLLVDLGSVVVSVLTSTSHGVTDSRRMPCSDTGDLSETLVSLSGQLPDSPTGSNSLKSVTFGNSDHVDHGVLFEDGVNGDVLLKETEREVNLLLDGSSVDLDFHNVSLLLELELSDLGVDEDSDNSAVLLDPGQLSLDSGLVLGVLLGVLGEGLLLRSVPVLVEPSLDLIAQMSSPNGGESTETSWGWDVTNNSNDDHRGSLNDGHSLNDFLLVDL